MEVISSDWIYIAANGTSEAVGKSKCSLARSQGNIRGGEGGEITRVLTLAQTHTHTHATQHTQLPTTCTYFLAPAFILPLSEIKGLRGSLSHENLPSE